MCDSNLSVANHGITKNQTAFATSGVGGVVCGHHTLVRKNGMGDLHRGEQ